MIKEPMCFLIPGIILSVLWLFGLGSGVAGEPEPLSGGPCTYKSYPGQARIVSIKEMVQPEGSSVKRYEIMFHFIPDGTIEESFVQVKNKDFFLLLNNNSYPGESFIKKCEIQVNSVFDCIMKVIVRGTCTPIMFQFPTMSLEDSAP
jgi:hypothetical protein